MSKYANMHSDYSTSTMDYCYSKSKSNDPFSPVLALTILDSDTFVNGTISESTKMMVVVRDPATNPSHPNVVSVPTQRITNGRYDEILATVKYEQEDEENKYYAGVKVSNLTHNMDHPVIAEVEHLLARKLGVADDLEESKFSFEALACITTKGRTYMLESEAEDAKEVGENIKMLNILLTIPNGSAIFPPKTKSYSAIVWTQIDRFLRTVPSRDTSLLGVGLDPIDFCIHGLCIKTAYYLLQHRLDLKPKMDY